MAKLKTVLTFMLAGAFFGNVVALLLAPSMIEWYNSTPLASQTMCDLPKVVRDVASQLIRAQFIGSGIGTVAFLVLGIVFLRFQAKREKALPPAPPATPTAV